jgi:YidC/Oxa1 family membrane protein insertase
MIVAGILSPVENVLTSILEWFHASVGLSWAWSIVALVVAVRLLLVPLAIRQIHSMQSLQAHAPEMKEIQQRYKHDKQRQNEELMKFYRENKINPAASCLPILVQIPIFIALFFVLRDFDDKIFPQYPDSSLDWLGLVEITQPVKDGWGILLLFVYVISQLTSSYFMSTTMQKAQRVLIMVLPVLFVPFILQFQAGLMIYWLTTNLWTTGQGIVTRTMIPRPPPPEKRTSRTPAKEPPAPPPDGKSPRTPPASGQRSGGQPSQPAGPPRRVKRKRGGSAKR